MASVLNRSVWPADSARSISAASFLAATEASPSGLAAALTGAGLAGAAPLPRGLPAGLAETFAATALRTDIDLVPLLDDLVFAQLELAVGHAFAGLDIVLVTVPGAHEVQLGVGEIQALRGLVGHDALFHLGDRQPLAGRSALVQAVIAVRIEGAVLAEHADFLVAHEHDATVAVLELGKLADKFLSHSKRFLHVDRGGRLTP